jgi:hypothetical protein
MAVKMDKKDLKTLIKPMIKECIREVLMEEGLAKVLAEGLAEKVIKAEPVVSKPVVEQVERPVLQKRLTGPNGMPLRIQEQPKVVQLKQEILKKIEKIDKKASPARSFDPFAGTAPLTEAQANGSPGSIDPEDPGIDISGLIGNSNKILAALGSGKK